MTAAEVLASAEVAGVDVYLRPDGTPAVRGNPSPALLAALKEHRAGVVRLLGGTPEPETCDGFTRRFKVKDEWREEQVRCGALVAEAVDSPAWCQWAGCPFRKRVRGHG